MRAIGLLSRNNRVKLADLLERIAEAERRALAYRITRPSPTVTAGLSCEVAVERNGMDVEVVLVGPQGKSLVTADGARVVCQSSESQTETLRPRIRPYR